MIILRVARPRVAEFWFDEPVTAKGIDVAILRQYGKPPPAARTDPFHTLIIDLGRTEEEILGSMKAGTRNEIRRDPAKDGLATEAFERPSAATVEDFVEFYRQFAAQKGVPPAQIRTLRVLNQANSLHLTRATVNGEAVVWHSYLTKLGRARLLHSASLFRDSDSNFRSLVGRANRLLHWRDIVFFRNSGMRIYDLGGWYEGSDDASRLAINKFKEGFGGVPLKEYSGEVARTWIGQLYLSAKRLRNAYLKSR